MKLYDRRDWKCRDCGMIGRKEPRRSLADHMLAKHGKRWDEQSQEYINNQQAQAAGEE